MLVYTNTEKLNFRQPILNQEDENLINKEIYLRTADTLLLKKGEIVLEINHNGADFLHYLFDFQSSIFYMGTENKNQKNLQAKYKNQNLYAKGKADFIICDNENIPLEDESFDKIFNINTLHHWKNIPNTLREIHRLLRKKGNLIISFENEVLAQNGIYNIEELIFEAGFSQIIKHKIKEYILLKNSSVSTKNMTIISFAKC